MAYARQLQGNLTGALEAMQLAAEASVGGDVEGMAWYRAQVGELYLELGRPHEAAEQFASASQAFPGHPLAVTGYARVCEMLGDVAGARTLLDDLVRRAPTPDAHVRLGDLLAASGRLDEAGRQYALAEAAWRSDMPEPANLARFLADQGLKLDGSSLHRRGRRRRAPRHLHRRRARLGVFQSRSHRRREADAAAGAPHRHP